jgi:2-methylcitrate dehydratase PrpD
LTNGATIGASRSLARFAAGLAWEDIPEAVRHAARRCLLNFFATAIGGSNEPAIAKASAAMTPFAGPATSTVIGRAERTDMLWASFLNAASANIFDFDDTHIPTIIHPTAPVAPVVLALAESRPINGRDLLTAFILGAEIECRIGNAVSPSHYQRGWHITSTCGVFGAALAAGKLLGLTEDQHLFALGNASVQTGGLVETLGTMSKSISVGNAARNGLLSALLAKQDFSGPDAPLEGPRGFLKVTANTVALDWLTEGLGQEWELLNNTFKPYPCGVVLNPVIDACLDIKARHEFDPSTIEHIIVTGHPLLRERTDRPGVTTGRLAQVSAQHAVPVALMTGKAGLAEFSDDSVADPQLRALGNKVRFTDNPGFSVDAADVRIVFADGREIASSIAHGRGSLGNPMSDDDLERKLAELVAYRGISLDAKALVQDLWNIDQAEDTGAIIERTAAL